MRPRHLEPLFSSQMEFMPTGGRVVNSPYNFGILTNRVAITKPVTLRSVNGALVTVIQGYQVPGTTNGNSAVRCLYLTNGGSIVGFTLTNGATLLTNSPLYYSSNNFVGGGIFCESSNEVVSNCVLSGNRAFLAGAGAYNGTFNNCTFSGNMGSFSISYGFLGGGAYSSILNGCTLIGNFAGSANTLGCFGGGAYACTLNNCLVSNNFATAGGGAGGSTLSNCTLSGNVGPFDGGGAYHCTLANCTVAGNSSFGYADPGGGGASFSILNYCILNNNNGGGTYSSTLNNCTLSNNSGTGATGSMLTNCTLVGNTGGGAHQSTLNKCTLTGNYGVTYGAGADYYCTLTNCLLSSNVASIGGGGASDHSTLVNCTVVGNIAGNTCGGLFLCSATNCIVMSNNAPDSPNFYYNTTNSNFSSTLSYCCTTPLPTNGTRQHHQRPAVRESGRRRFPPAIQLPLHQRRQQCLRTNDHRPRRQPAHRRRHRGHRRVRISIAHLAHLLRLAPAIRLCHRRLRRFPRPRPRRHEQLSGMARRHRPHQCRLRPEPSQVPPRSGTNLIVTWQSVTNASYYLQRATNLTAQPAFLPLATNLVGHSGTTSYTDTNAAGPGPFFYRVGVQ